MEALRARDSNRSPTSTPNRSQTSRGHRIRLELRYELLFREVHVRPVTAPLSRFDLRRDFRRADLKGRYVSTMVADRISFLIRSAISRPRD